MQCSNDFIRLRTRLAELRLNMLPHQFSATGGNYSDQDLDRARGYRLLAHAELEFYLESVVRNVITNAIKAWKTNNQPSNIIIAFLAAYHSAWNNDDLASNEDIIKLAKNRKNAKDSISEVIELAQTQFIKILKDNHGVKEKNLKSLILPTGIDISMLDSTWITDLDTFGALRGTVAHNTKALSSEINPRDEFLNVEKLLHGIYLIDFLIMDINKSFN